MHFCQLTDLFRKQEVRVDPGNEKKKQNPLDILQVPDSFVATTSCLEHSRHYLLSTAVESSSPILAPGWPNSVNHLQRVLQTLSHRLHINPSQTYALNTQNADDLLSIISMIGS